MTASESVRYRLALAAGFLVEARQDRELQRWRSCVDNSPLVVENAGKAVLLLFGMSPKTHDPGRQLTELLRTDTVASATPQPLPIKSGSGYLPRASGRSASEMKVTLTSPQRREKGSAPVRSAATTNDGPSG
jgi:hypothetical protein